MDWYNYALLLPLIWLLWRYRRPIHYYLKFTSLFLYVSSHAFIAVFIAIFTKPWDPTTINLVRYTMPTTNYLFGFKMDIKGENYLDTDRGGFVICNHQYAFDIVVLYNIWPIARRMTVIAKKLLFYIWPFGLASWLLGVAFIDRDNPAKSYETMQQLSELTVGKKPTKILVFVEGTRNNDCFKSKKMLPFKKGAFKMAIGCQVPITPIVIGPLYFVNPSAYYFGNGTISMRILEPIETTGMTDNDVNDLLEKTQKVMQDVYDELCNELKSKLPKTHPFLCN